MLYIALSRIEKKKKRYFSNENAGFILDFAQNISKTYY